MKEERSRSMPKNERGQKEIERNKRKKEEVRREGKGEQGERGKREREERVTFHLSLHIVQEYTFPLHSMNHEYY